MPSAGASELQSALATGVALLTLAVFTAPQLASMLIETPLLLWADRRARSSMIALGLAGMGLSLIAAGLTTTTFGFALAFALYAPSSGLACGLAQATLMDADPDRRERRMAAWALSGTLGDLAAPLLIAAVLALSLSFRAAWLTVGATLVVLALGVKRMPLSAAPSTTAETAPPPFWTALKNPRLLLWLFGVALCGLLDETLVALTALWVTERFPREPQAVTVILTAGTVGGTLGLLALDRLLARYSPRLLLAVAGAGSVVAYLLWLKSESVWGAALLMFAVDGLACALYPIAQAQAYRAAEGRSGLVAAAGTVLSGFDLAAPIALGWLADRFGLSVALSALLLQPLGLLAILCVDRHFRRFPSHG